MAKGGGGVGRYGVAWLGACAEVVGGGRGDSGGDAVGLAPVPEPGAARGICAVECEGVGGPEDDGDNGSVTQSLQGQNLSIQMVKLAYRCDFVATIFATVCARVEPGLTWKTGKESLPSIRPRVDRITEIK